MDARRANAIDLRKSGYLYTEIAHELNVPKSTVHGWLKGIYLSPKQERNISERLKAVKRPQTSKLIANNKLAHEKIIFLMGQKAQKIVSAAALTVNQKRLLCALFMWCEGAKDVRAGITFINSDPQMVRVFLKFLRQAFDLDETKFRALVHLHEYHDKDQQLLFWSGVTKIPLAQFHKSYIKPHTGKNKREGYPGCISIRYLDSVLGKLIKMIYIEFCNKHVGVSVNW